MIRLVASHVTIGVVAAVIVVAYIGGWTVREVVKGFGKKSRKGDG